MKEGNQGVLTMIYQNQASKFETKFKEFEKWFVKQSLPVATAVYTVMGALEGAANGFVLNTIFQGVSGRSIPTSLDPEVILSWVKGHKPLVESSMIGSSLELARNYAVKESVNSGITYVMIRLRGKEDVQTRMVAGFGYGVMLSLVTGMRGPSVISLGVMFALGEATLFKVEDFPEKGSLTNIKQRYESISAFQDARCVARFPK